MKNKKNLFFYIFISLIIGLSLNTGTKKKYTDSKHKIPKGNTEIIYNQEELENHDLKRKWFRDLHPISKGKSWKKIEGETAKSRVSLRKSYKRNHPFREDDESLADGQLIGEWIEIGSNNQAGSVLATEYVKDKNEIWLISSGGSLWKTVLGSNEWEVVNDELQFNSRFLEISQQESVTRIFTILDRIIHYSDDGGHTWIKAEGLETYYDNYGWRATPIFFDNNGVSFQKIQEWSELENSEYLGLYKSDNNGVSYDKVIDFGQVGYRRISFCKPDKEDSLYMFRVQNTESGLFVYNVENNRFDTIGIYSNFVPLSINLKRDINGVFYLQDGSSLYMLDKSTQEWKLVSDLPITPWADAFFISPSNPDFMLIGGVECYKSINGGKDWQIINQWWDYYDNRDSYLHADMMYFNEFITVDDRNLLLISNHGGLNISYDKMAHTQSISNVGGLNVSQYYSVRSYPGDPYWIFGGTQDQGFQRGLYYGDKETVSFEQPISGDYGHIVFTGPGHLWMVYPGGNVSLYREPKFGSHSAGWELPNSDNSAWIMPIVVDPHSDEDIVYLVGGSEGDASGSYLHKLIYSNGYIQSEELAFDFKNESGGYVSGLAFDSFDENKWYACTSNGLFYYSNDKGVSWDLSAQVGPAPHYLYGTNILPSQVEENLVYFAGSGYDTEPVYKSVDGGEFFTSISDGMPSTVVLDICSNSDETMLFAATQAGPYVYIVSDNKWYDMSGMNAPTQTYWSVEYIEEINVVRFGTYGRGIWDFKIKDVSSVIDSETTIEALDIYPNRSSEFIQIANVKPDTKYSIYNNNGRLVKKGLYSYRIDISSLESSLYYISLSKDNKKYNGKFIKL